METIEQKQSQHRRLLPAATLALVGTIALLAGEQTSETIAESERPVGITVSAATWARPEHEVSRNFNRGPLPPTRFPSPVSANKHIATAVPAIKASRLPKPQTANRGFWYGNAAAKRRLNAEGLQNAQSLYNLGLARGLSKAAIGCMQNIGSFESSFRVTAKNKSSGAYGIPQVLGSMKAAGTDWKTNATTQELYMMAYVGEVKLPGINAHYSSACSAWGSWLIHRSY